ncbi:MAG: aquaporin [Euryarchaeota archaeon]|nr:aquaporin [Euryarchaeota archaeon]
MADASDWWKPCIAEFVGVFTLVYIGAGAIVATGGTNLVAIALAHGLALAVMITALAHISGGHFNPAVTVAALFTKRIQWELGLLYIIFQLLGGIFGAFLLVASFPGNAWEPVKLGTPAVVGITAANAVIVEAVMTFFLVFVIFGVAIDGRNLMKAVGGFAIGLTVTMDILMGGPITGAAMNPARAFGPALLSRTWEGQLIYWAGPLLGGIMAGLVYDNAFLQPTKKDDAPRETTMPTTPPPST